jgi:hypothetical protein
MARIVACAVALYMPTYLRLLPSSVKGVPFELAAPVALVKVFYLGGPPSDLLVHVLRIATFVGLGLVLIGFKTRLTSVLTAAALLSYLGICYSYGIIVCLFSPLSVTFLLGAFLPWGDALSVDAWRRKTPAASPEAHGAYVRLIHALMGLIYLGGALQKIRHTAHGWLGGDELRGALIENSFGRMIDPVSLRLDLTDVWQRPVDVASHLPLLPWLLAHRQACSALGVFTIVFEATFFLSFFWRRLLWPFLAGAFLFHLGIFLSMKISILAMFPMFAALLPWEKLRGRWPLRRRGASASGA